MNQIIAYRKKSKIHVSDHFKVSEFHCKCGYDDCNETLLAPILVACCEAIRMLALKPVIVTSGYRCQRHNSDVGGGRASQHKVGLAADVIVPNYDMSLIYEYVLTREYVGGVGRYYRDGQLHRLHIDFRERTKHIGPVLWSKYEGDRDVS